MEAGITAITGYIPFIVMDNAEHSHLYIRFIMNEFALSEIFTMWSFVLRENFTKTVFVLREIRQRCVLYLGDFDSFSNA